MKHKFTGTTARELARSIEEAVHSGALAPGAPLPPIRQLAASVRLSPVTVAAAYRRLRSRGLVEGYRRRGTSVRLNPASPLLPADQQPVPDGLIDLAGGNPDPEMLAPLTIGASGTRRPVLYGEPALLAPLVSFASAEFAADGVVPHHLTMTSGALDAIERLLREHLRPGDRIAVEDPCLPALLDLIGASGFSVIAVTMDADGALPDEVAAAIEGGARAVILTPRAHNPTGAAFSPSRASVLRRVLRSRSDVLVIENDPAGPVAGVPYLTVTIELKRWAVVRSVSKFLGPDLRLAIVCGDALTIARVQGRQSLGCRWVSHLLQQTTLALWSDPSSGRRLAHAADVYSARRGAFVTALAEKGVSIDCRSGFNVWIPVREETSVVQRLAQHGWAVAAGERFRIRCGPAVRVTASALTVDQAPRLAADIAAVLDRSSAAAV